MLPTTLVTHSKCELGPELAALLAVAAARGQTATAVNTAIPLSPLSL